MKLIKKPMTLEQYEAKYPHYQTKLISFSDNEIKEFNNKFHKANGKDIPNKYALLEKYKWVHIKDRYYQIPRVSKLGKAGIALGGAAAIACAVVLPLTLNKSGINISEQEFKDSLMYIKTESANRKFHAKGQTYECMKFYSSNAEVEESNDLEIGINGYYSKFYRKNLETSEEKTEYQYRDGKRLFEYYDNNKVWERQNSDDPSNIDVITGTYSDLSNNFSKFTKINQTTYKVDDLDCTSVIGQSLVAESALFKIISSKTSSEIQYNNNKTVKSIKENQFVEIGIDTPYENVDNKNSITIFTFKFEYNLEFSDIGTYVIQGKDNPDFEFPEDYYIYDFYIDENAKSYASDRRELTAEGIHNHICLKILESTETGNPLPISNIEMHRYNKSQSTPIPFDDESIELNSVKINGTETTDYTISSDGEIVLNNAVTETDDTIEINFDYTGEDLDNIYVNAYKEEESSEFNLTYDSTRKEYSNEVMEETLPAGNYTFTVEMKENCNIKSFVIFDMSGGSPEVADFTVTSAKVGEDPYTGHINENGYYIFDSLIERYDDEILEIEVTTESEISNCFAVCDIDKATPIDLQYDSTNHVYSTTFSKLYDEDNEIIATIDPSDTIGIKSFSISYENEGTQYINFIDDYTVNVVDGNGDPIDFSKSADGTKILFGTNITSGEVHYLIKSNDSSSFETNFTAFTSKD